MHRCTISHIDPDSPLRHAAHPGDRLVSINGNPITDVLDYKYYAYDPELAVCLRRPDGTEHTVHVSKPLGGELGLDFRDLPPWTTPLVRQPLRVLLHRPDAAGYAARRCISRTTTRA